jgi:serine/threonine protein kinase
MTGGPTGSGGAGASDALSSLADAGTTMSTRLQRQDLEPTVPVELDYATGSRPALVVAASAQDERTEGPNPHEVKHAERKPWMPPDFTGMTLGGRYEIERMLGFGGMATVYQASHIQIHKPVAVKVLNPEYGDDREIAGRFLQEARTASKLRHEHIIDITDFGHTDDGTVFFVMELLEGEDLSATLVEEGPLPAARVIAIGKQICDALACAHRNGIIHRDIKPANCFRISRAGTPDFIKVLDFGIAKVAGDVDRMVQRTTGAPLGTPGYMALELIKGEQYDHRVDIYALGVLMYKLLTNKMPFPAASAFGSAVLQLDGDAVPPSKAAPDREIPAALEALILRALARAPGDRHQSAEQLRDDLLEIERALHRESRLDRDPLNWEDSQARQAQAQAIAAAAGASSARLADPQPRSRAAILTTLLVLIAALFALVASLGGFSRGPSHPTMLTAQLRALHLATAANREISPPPSPSITPLVSDEAGPSSERPVDQEPDSDSEPKSEPAPARPPNKLSRGLITGRLRSLSAVTTCKAHHSSGFGSDPPLAIALTIEGPSGRVQEARALNGGALAPVGACVLEAVKAMTFPPAQKDSSISYTFVF